MSYPRPIAAAQQWTRKAFAVIVLVTPSTLPYPTPSAIFLDNDAGLCYIPCVKETSLIPSLGLRPGVKPKAYRGPKPLAEHKNVALGAIQQVVFNGEKDA